MGKSDFTKGVIFTAAGGIGWGISGICGQYIFHEYAVDSSWMTADFFGTPFAFDSYSEGKIRDILLV